MELFFERTEAQKEMAGLIKAIKKTENHYERLEFLKQAATKVSENPDELDGYKKKLENLAKTEQEKNTVEF